MATTHPDPEELSATRVEDVDDVLPPGSFHYFDDQPAKALSARTVVECGSETTACKTLRGGRRLRRCAACNLTGQGQMCAQGGDRSQLPSSTKRGLAPEMCVPAKRIRLPSLLTDTSRQQNELRAEKKTVKQTHRKCPVCGAPCFVEIISTPHERQCRCPSGLPAVEKQDRGSYGTPDHLTPSRSRSTLCFSPPDLSFVLEHFDPLAPAESPSHYEEKRTVGGKEAKEVVTVEKFTKNVQPKLTNKGGSFSAQKRGTLHDPRDKTSRSSLGMEVTHLTVDGANILSDISIPPILVGKASSTGATAESATERHTKQQRRGTDHGEEVTTAGSQTGFGVEAERRSGDRILQREGSRNLPLSVRSMYRPLVRKSVSTTLRRVLRALQRQGGLHPLLCETFKLDMGLMVATCSDLWPAQEHEPAVALVGIRERLEPLSRKLYAFERLVKRPLTLARAMVVIRDQVHLGFRAMRHALFTEMRSFRKDEVGRGAK